MRGAGCSGISPHEKSTPVRIGPIRNWHFPRGERDKQDRGGPFKAVPQAGDRQKDGRAAGRSSLLEVLERHTGRTRFEFFLAFLVEGA